MGLKKVYWVTLVQLVKKLCRYWLKNKHAMPSDLPIQVKSALDALVIACDLLLAYDAAHARGE